jgi:hypothetical protein
MMFYWKKTENGFQNILFFSQSFDWGSNHGSIVAVVEHLTHLLHILFGWSGIQKQTKKIQLMILLEKYFLQFGRFFIIN